jgi:hypothetical protein
MYLDSRYAVEYPDSFNSFELAAKLLAACPSAMVNLKNPKEIFDKVMELAELLAGVTCDNKS